jgi:hypothetical protein
MSESTSSKAARAVSSSANIDDRCAGEVLSALALTPDARGSSLALPQTQLAAEHVAVGTHAASPRAVAQTGRRFPRRPRVRSQRRGRPSRVAAALKRDHNASPSPVHRLSGRRYKKKIALSVRGFDLDDGVLLSRQRQQPNGDRPHRGEKSHPQWRRRPRPPTARVMRHRVRTNAPPPSETRSSERRLHRHAAPVPEGSEADRAEVPLPIPGAGSRSASTIGSPTRDRTTA